jgi:flagellin-like protein
MSMNTALSSGRKGITPIIATVLLLGITVAIGLTVYTQAQGLIEGTGGTEKFDKVRSTDIQLSPVFGDGGAMELQVSNKGERAINVSKYTIYYGPPNWDPVSYDTIETQTEWNTSGGNECFTSAMSPEVLQPGERTGCTTGVEFPGALEAVEIRVDANTFDYSTSYTCSVDSSSAMSC